MRQKINRITDILRRDDGISGAMHYTEQISWILFLKFIDDFETREADNAMLDGKDYEYILKKEYRWNNWVHLQNGMISGDDLKDFVNKQLFPYLKAFRNSDEDYHSIKYKIGEIFHFIDNRIESGHTLREILDIIDDLNFQKQEDLFELSHVYEDLLQGMGNDGGNSGEFYTPRSVIKIMVDTINPKIGETVYDPATGNGTYSLSGPKKEGQQIPYRIEVKLKLPQVFLDDFLILNNINNDDIIGEHLWKKVEEKEKEIEKDKNKKGKGGGKEVEVEVVLPMIKLLIH